MIIDFLKNASMYYAMGERIEKGLKFLQSTDLAALAIGTHPIDGDDVVAKVSEYTTIDSAEEKMEAHNKFIDIQYWVSGEEKIGHDMLRDQTLATPYNETKDVYTVNEPPSFFSVMKQGMFAIYFPEDLHMPGLMNDTKTRVKKVVTKVRL